jgi:16S rRNA (guanine966-N2)-methyltransferase
MRVVAGELGGRRLQAPRSEAVRPTADRVREALFSILGDVGEMLVLDLFCGTGALGIEAVSRGAAAATFVDTDIRPARANVESLGIAERAELVRSDAARFLATSRGAFDLIFCDPPYSIAPRLGPELDKLLPPRLTPGARVIVETAAADTLELSLPQLDERRYGSTAIRIHGAPGA